MKKVQVTVLALLLLIITITNIRGLLQNYYGFYYPEDKSRKSKNRLLSFLNDIQDYRYYNVFNTYSGLETGYGFFAPNVASDFVVHFTLYDEKNMPVDSTNFIPLSSKEGMIRITTAYNMFLELNNSDSVSQENQKLLIFIKGMAGRTLEYYAPAVAVKADLYLYHFPTLSQLKADREMQPLMLLFYTKTFTSKDYETWQ